MTYRAYIVSRALEHKIAIAVNNDQNTMLVTLDVLKEILAVLKEQEDDYKNILSDYEDLAREHERLLNKKIPLITNGQEVVRCKDCKKHDTYDCSITYLTTQKTPNDWFCADGERR